MSNRNLKDKRPRSTARTVPVRYAYGMGKKGKSKWEKKRCGCVKTTLLRAGKITIRCGRHRGRPTKTDRGLCYFDDGGQVRAEP